MPFFSGTPSQTIQLQRFTPQQQEITGKLGQSALQSLQGLQQNRPDFAPIARKAETEFQQRTVPSILERLTAMGGLHSSALAGSLGEAGAGLRENLAAQQQQFNLANRGQDLQLLSMLLGGVLQPQFENLYQPEQQSGLSGLLQSGAAGLGTGLGTFLSSGANPLAGLSGILSFLGNMDKSKQQGTAQGGISTGATA